MYSIIKNIQWGKKTIPKSYFGCRMNLRKQEPQPDAELNSWSGLMANLGRNTKKLIIF